MMFVDIMIIIIIIIMISSSSSSSSSSSRCRRRCRRIIVNILFILVLLVCLLRLTLAAPQELGSDTLKRPPFRDEMLALHRIQAQTKLRYARFARLESGKSGLRPNRIIMLEG